MSVQKECADQVRKAVTELNVAMRRAASWGLDIRVDIDQLQVIGESACPVIAVEVSRREVL